jgi:hypothetical protein
MNSDQQFRSSAATASQSNTNTNTNTNANSNNRPSSNSDTKDMRALVGDAVSKVTEAAQQASGDVKDAAMSFAADANKKATGLLNQQFSVGADFAEQIADSVNAAADSLESKSPQLANFVRMAAETVEDFSNDIRGQTVQQLVRTASEYTRKQPALVFGLASLAGFALFRVLKSSTPANGNAHMAETGTGGNQSMGRSMGGGSRTMGTSSTGTGAGDGRRSTTGQFHGA